MVAFEQLLKEIFEVLKQNPEKEMSTSKEQML